MTYEYRKLVEELANEYGSLDRTPFDEAARVAYAIVREKQLEADMFASESGVESHKQICDSLKVGDAIEACKIFAHAAIVASDLANEIHLASYYAGPANEEFDDEFYTAIG